jgi:type VI secretion system protein ImpE
MNIKELLNAGELATAVEQMTREVKANPMQTVPRISLFELLSLNGEWDRAEKQLLTLSHMDATQHFGVQVYLHNIKAEKAREQFLSAGVPPHFLSEPPAYIDLLLSARQKIREDQPAEAARLMRQAEEDRPALAGTLNEIPFSDFRDADDAGGSVLELIIHDKYTWVPWGQIRRLEIAPPRQLRDMIWTPAKIQSQDGTQGEVFLFSLYPRSWKHENNMVRLGRVTEWLALNQEVYLPVGLRLFLVDEQEFSIFEGRSLCFAERKPAPQEEKKLSPTE